MHLSQRPCNLIVFLKCLGLQKMFNFQQKFFEFETCYNAASKPLDIRVYKSYKGKVCLCLTHKPLDLSFKIFKGMNSATICYLAANFHKYIPRQ